MNNTIISGRLIKDPELRYLQGGQAVVRFTLAVDKELSRDKKSQLESQGKPTADFINCQAWGKMAENVAKFTGKGKRVLVQGRIQTGSYQDKDGKTVYTTDIVANSVEFIDWKDTGKSYSSSNQNSFDNSTEVQNVPSSNDFEFGNDFDPTDDGRIPF